jgi:rhamnosyltransferase
MFVSVSEGRGSIALGFVTYAAAEPLLSRLQMADRAGFTCYLFDNSPESELVRNGCRTLERCSYLTCGKNVGLGYGLSSVCAQAYYDGCSCLLFFDQDTIFTADTLAFIDLWHRQNGHIRDTHSAVVFNASAGQTHRGERTCNVRDVPLAISSGSLFFLDNLRKLNWHNEKYFVDCVDYEFCLRSSNNDFKVGEYSCTPGFDHESEQPDVKQIVFGRETLVRKYSRDRIFRTTFASVRLLFRAIGSGNISFAVLMARSLAIYLFLQIVARTRHLTARAESNG